MNRLPLLALLALTPLLSPQATHAQLTFEEGDRIAYLGNSLADRMQHDGWLETLLQSIEADKKLVFRNLGFTGDKVDSRPRANGFTSPEDYLKHVQADVIFSFFGYNESFDDKPQDFQNKLAAMIDSYRALKPNGSSEPRIVLFSPIAHEDLGDPNLPDGSANNARLAAYTEATKAAAEAKGAVFVDLFSPTLQLFAQHPEPLIINGVHLNAEGNRRVAELAAAALTGKAAEASPSLEPLREAVLEKNWHWYHRYRATDGNDIWGSRAGLAFVDGQTNRDVLEHELKMLDVMTANRDARVHARAAGGDLQVDDSNVPPAIPVTSNVGGGSPSSNAGKEGFDEYLSPEESIDLMRMPEGFEVSLFASEREFPELVNPVQIQVDGHGNLWVAAWGTYPKWEPLQERNDRILTLHDDDGDGVADRCVTFAVIDNPLAFEFWNGGVIVSAQPDIFFLRDTTGDGVADEKFVLLQGICSADTHHAANNFRLGPDGAVYWQSGIFLHNAHEHPWGPPLSTGASGMYRFDPRRYTVSFHAPNSPNPHGTAFDRWGYHYATDGTGGNAFQVVPKGKGFEMRKLLDKQVRPVPSSLVVSSSNFPDDMQGNFLILNTIGFLGIKNYQLDRNPDTGHVWGTPDGDRNDLLVSDDKNFRPTDAIFGADGALYIADWQNRIIGHMQHNVRDPSRDKKHGRIFRMTHKGGPQQAPVAIAGQPIPALMKNLEHPIDGVRHRARIELSARDSAEVIAACNDWLATLDPEDPGHALAFLEGLWLHQQHNVRNGELLATVLRSPEPHARIAAATVQHHWYTADPALGSSALPKETELATDSSSGVLSIAEAAATVAIGTLIEKMSFDLKEFTVPAGAKIDLTFSNPDFLPHNFVLVQKDAADEVGEAAMALGAAGFELQFIPQSDKILAHTKMLDHGTEEKITFTAPTEPGNYPYVCTFPGHHLVMRGIMKVAKWEDLNK